MKRIVFFSILSALMLFGVENIFGAAQNPTVRGGIVDEQGIGIGYATVVVLSKVDSLQVAVATGGEDGRFAVAVPQDDYLVLFSCLGFGDEIRELTLSSDTDMGQIVMRQDITELEAVTVTARAITREADRFVVNIANNPVTIGKDAFEMLKVSPGVWVSNDGITVNGRQGTKIMINDRLIRMSGDELEAYLRSINAQDISKIEIIPDSGADYDADSSGGIIKITLRKQRNDGIDGSVSLNSGTGYYGNHTIAPSANINYKSGKFSLYTNLGYGYNKSFSVADEETIYDETSAIPGVISTAADKNGRSNSYNGMLGAFYDIDDRQNIGLEFGAYGGPGENITDGVGTYGYRPALASGMDETRTKSHYGTTVNNIYYSGTLNYLYKLDDKGSVFKLIGDYVQSVGNNPNTFESSQTHYWEDAMVGTPVNMLYRSNSDTDYRVMSLTANADLMISPKMVIKTGAKYTNNDMYSRLVYDDWNPAGDVWNIRAAASSITDYTENIAALYAIYSGTLGRFNVSAGLRGEYTFVNPQYRGFADNGDETVGEGKKQSYFDLFPNLNVAYPLNANGSNMLVLSYSRRISRPDFSYLSPFRNPLSDYSQIAGNPDLKAMYSNSFSLSGVIAYKYNITIGALMMENQIMQRVVPDGDMLLYQFVNILRTWQYYAAVNAPVTFTKWWTANFNLTAGDLQQQLDAGGPTKRKLFGVASVSMNFSLPADFDIELSGYAMSRIINANIESLPMYNFNAGVKKSFSDNKFTTSLGVNNILNVRQKVYSYGPGFEKWISVLNNGIMTAYISFRYNFRAGEKFRARQIEKGSAEDTQRIGNARQ